MTRENRQEGESARRRIGKKANRHRRQDAADRGAWRHVARLGRWLPAVVVGVIGCLPTSPGEDESVGVVEQALDDVEIEAAAQGNCFTEPHPFLPNVQRRCCGTRSLRVVVCAPYKCTSGFQDCNKDLNQLKFSDGCECGPCASGCNGTQCKFSFVNKTAGQTCDSVALVVCQKCVDGLTCTEPGGFPPGTHKCCAPQGVACGSKADCCTTGVGNTPPSGQKITCDGTCKFCANQLGAACGPSLPCCGESGLACINGQCKSCLPKKWLSCKDVSTCPTCLGGDGNSAGTCTDNTNKTFKGCCTPDYPINGVSTCGTDGWCCK